jgi:hypothetical protein
MQLQARRFYPLKSQREGWLHPQHPIRTRLGPNA